MVGFVKQVVILQVAAGGLGGHTAGGLQPTPQASSDQGAVPGRALGSGRHEEMFGFFTS